MANLRDGGHIIIGIKESGSSFEKEGISENDLNSYDIDSMRDKLGQYADPAVNFWLTRLVDEEGKKFVVISIAGFAEVPVITKKQIDGNLLANTIYYRNTNRRTESAPVSNSEDLREIIEQAAIKMMRRRKNAGFEIIPIFKETLDSELNAVADSQILTKIKSNAYWQLIFQPLNDQNISSNKEKEDLIRDSQVKLAWYFPMLPIRENMNQYFIREDQYLGSLTEFGSRKQFFAFFNTGQFICYDSLTEDWLADDSAWSNNPPTVPPGKYVFQYNSIIHYITAATEFLGRLIQKGIYKEGLNLVMKLNNVRGREIYRDIYGSPFISAKITHANVITLTKKINVPTVDFVPLELANELILYTLDKFDLQIDPQSLKVLQDNYMNGR
jgi:hypothetical protein